eukprot:ctg_3681.g614
MPDVAAGAATPPPQRLAPVPQPRRSTTEKMPGPSLLPCSVSNGHPSRPPRATYPETPRALPVAHPPAACTPGPATPPSLAGRRWRAARCGRGRAPVTTCAVPPAVGHSPPPVVPRCGNSPSGAGSGRPAARATDSAAPSIVRRHPVGRARAYRCRRRRMRRPPPDAPPTPPRRYSPAGHAPQRAVCRRRRESPARTRCISRDTADRVGSTRSRRWPRPARCATAAAVASAAA